MPPLLRSSARLTLLFALLNCICYAQNVLTWHNDINRTGWQQNESVLTPSALHAYDATNLASELYNGRNQNLNNPTGYPRKFITPTISNGRVFVGAVVDTTAT